MKHCNRLWDVLQAASPAAVCRLPEQDASVAAPRSALELVLEDADASSSMARLTAVRATAVAWEDI